MRIVGKVLLNTLIAIAILAALSFALPGSIKVERSITVNAAPEQIFPHLNDLRKFKAWSPLTPRDPKATYDFTGSDEGVGQIMMWSSETGEVGSGTMEIIESEENRLVRAALDFGERGWANSTFMLEPQGGSTKVTWGFETEFGNNPLRRWMGLMLERRIGADYEDGLKRLKQTVETA
jgi:uncharacterized protein YndB with AHSA1/START domain